MDPFEKEIKRAANASESARRSPAKILLAAPAGEHDPQLIRAIEERGDMCIRVERPDQAALLMQADAFELLLLSPALHSAAAKLIQTLHERSPAAKLVMFSLTPTADMTIQAMRLGAVDFIHLPVDAVELNDRLDAAIAKARADQRRENRLTRLKVICQELNTARREIAEQFDTLCTEMASAYQGMNDQITETAMASEFRTLIKQELDVEDMLRTSLEYTLAKTGPTNAAVFLADDDSRFSLGAYVNYDCPRETIAEVLEQLGSAICPQMADESELISFEDAREFAEWLEIDTGMLAESQVIAFSCMHESDCLAVVVLFRSKSKPFTDSLASVIETLRPIFAEQLSNIMRVHHRAMPSWPEEALGEDDEYNFDDPWNNYGFGGLAA